MASHNKSDGYKYCGVPNMLIWKHKHMDAMMCLKLPIDCAYSRSHCQSGLAKLIGMAKVSWLKGPSCCKKAAVIKKTEENKIYPLAALACLTSVTSQWAAHLTLKCLLSLPPPPFQTLVLNSQGMECCWSCSPGCNEYHPQRVGKG